MYSIRKSSHLFNKSPALYKISRGLINFTDILNRSSRGAEDNPNSSFSSSSSSDSLSTPSSDSSLSSSASSNSIFGSSLPFSFSNTFGIKKNGESIDFSNQELEHELNPEVINLKKEQKDKEEQELLELHKTRTKMKKLQHSNKNYLYFPVSKCVDDQFICPFVEEEKISLVDSYNLFLSPSSKFEYSSSATSSATSSSTTSTTSTTSSTTSSTTTSTSSSALSSPKPIDSASLVPIEAINEEKFFDPSGTHLTWLGHDTILYSLEGTRILINPFFNQKIKKNFFSFYNKLDKLKHKESSSVIQKADNKFNFLNKKANKSLKVENIQPNIILITSNNYTNYCQNSIKFIGNLALWIVPLGMKDYLRTQFNVTNCVELNWWENYSYIRPNGELINIIMVPTIYEDKAYVVNSLNKGYLLKYMHRNSSLLGNFIINFRNRKVFYSNITGYNKDFYSNLRNLYGNFDLSILPIGSYKPQRILKNLQVNPENSLKISREINSKETIGISWGTFESFDLNPLEPTLELGRIREKYCSSISEFYTVPINKTIYFGEGQKVENSVNDFVYNNNEIFHSYLNHLRLSSNLTQHTAL